MKTFLQGAAHSQCHGWESSIDHRIMQLQTMYHRKVHHGGMHEDRWSFEGKSACWTRVHSQPRMELFTPAKSWHGPQALEKLSDVRITTGKFVDGGEFCITDQWRDDNQCHRVLKSPWIGTTKFVEQAKQ